MKDKNKDNNLERTQERLKVKARLEILILGIKGGQKNIKFLLL